MNGRTIERDPQWFARLGGGLYLAIIVAGGFAEGFVRNGLIVGGDPVATASRIARSPGLWQLSIGAELVMVVFALILAVIEYGLLKPVDRFVATVAFAMNLASIGLEFVDKVVLVAATSVLNNGAAFDVFAPDQRAALAYLLLRMHSANFNVSLMIFGVVCLLLGNLLFRSGYFPRAIGVLMQVAGVCYLIATIAAIFFPRVEDLLFPYILLPPLIGELSFCLWLLVKGVDPTSWRRRLDEPSTPT